MKKDTDLSSSDVITTYLKRKYTSSFASVIDKLGKFIGIPVLVISLFLSVFSAEKFAFILYSSLYYVLFMYWLADKLEKRHVKPNTPSFFQQVKTSAPNQKKLLWIHAVYSSLITVLGLYAAGCWLFAAYPQKEEVKNVFLFYLLNIFIPIIFIFIFAVQKINTAKKLAEIKENTPAA